MKPKHSQEMTINWRIERFVERAREEKRRRTEEQIRQIEKRLQLESYLDQSRTNHDIKEVWE